MYSDEQARWAYDRLGAANGCLLVFVDDTGHETFAGDQPYYGLGGCAVMIEAYEPLKARWKSLRRLINGHEDLPLHASTLKRDPTHLAVLAAGGQGLLEFGAIRAFAGLDLGVNAGQRNRRR